MKPFSSMARRKMIVMESTIWNETKNEGRMIFRNLAFACLAIWIINIYLVAPIMVIISVPHGKLGIKSELIEREIDITYYHRDFIQLHIVQANSEGKSAIFKQKMCSCELFNYE